MPPLIQQIINDPLSALMIIGNLILIESLLSIDNAAVLATMVLALPPEERSKALKYGIFGAYTARGICLLLAAFLVKIWWLKVLGGVYLIYIFVSWARKKKRKPGGEATESHAGQNKLYELLAGRIGSLWAAIVSVELMDLAFSMDNVFAAVAFSNNILIIMCGVFIGILAMRFIAQGFVRLIQQFPFLESCAYVVVGLLGVKLAASALVRFSPGCPVSCALTSSSSDMVTSAVVISIFLLPLLGSLLFNFPRRRQAAGK